MGSLQRLAPCSCSCPLPQAAIFSPMKLITLILFVLASVRLLALDVATLNCLFLVDPSRPPEGQLNAERPSPEVYATKLENLAGLAKGPDLVAIEEVGSGIEAAALASHMGAYSVRFAQGTDTYTGQDVAVLVASRPTLKVRSSGRVPTLGILSKHLLVSLEDGGKRFDVLAVHLIRPIGKNAEKHAKQLEAIRAWVETQQARSPNTTVIVLGDFNNPDKDLLPFADSGRETNFAATHLTGKAFDRIFTTGKLSAVEIVRPPLPKRPNELLKASWTDHYLLKAKVTPAQ